MENKFDIVFHRRGSAPSLPSIIHNCKNQMRRNIRDIVPRTLLFLFVSVLLCDLFSGSASRSLTILLKMAKES